MNENISMRAELQPFKDLFTFLINQNLQLTENVKQIKLQMNHQYEHLTQQTKDYQFKIDQLEQKLNQQIEYNQNLNNEFNLFKQNLNDQIQTNQNLTDKLNLVEENFNQHNNRLTKLDNDQQESSIQSKQHLQFVQHRLNYLSEFYRNQ